MSCFYLWGFIAIICICYSRADCQERHMLMHPIAETSLLSDTDSCTDFFLSTMFLSRDGYLSYSLLQVLVSLIVFVLGLVRSPSQWYVDRQLTLRGDMCSDHLPLGASPTSQLSRPSVRTPYGLVFRLPSLERHTALGFLQATSRIW